MKKTRSMLAVLICVVMLATLFAVSASAVGTASSTADFMGCTPTDKGDATHAVMSELGVSVPADSGAWQIVDHFYKVLLPGDGYSKCSYVQTLEAPNGEVFATDVALEIAYGLANKDADGNPLPEVGQLVVYTSVDGENWTESWANREGHGRLYDSTAFRVVNTSLAGTAGVSKLYVKVELIRFNAETSGCIGYTKLNADTRGVNEVVSNIDVRKAQNIAAGGALTGEAAHAELERLGFTIEGDVPWMIQDCYWFQATPKDGYQLGKLIHTMEAGKGKVFDGNVSLTAGFWTAITSDPCIFVVEYSTDGENWTEVYADRVGSGAEYTTEAYKEGTLPLPNTDGAAKVQVRYSIQRHGGSTAGAISLSTLVGQVKDAPAGSDPTGDPIAVVLALFCVGAAGAVITTKKFRV